MNNNIPTVQRMRYEKMEEFIQSINYGGELYNVFQGGQFRVPWSCIG